MLDNKKDSIILKEDGENYYVLITDSTQFTIKKTKNNKKLLYVLLRLFKDKNGKNLLTFSKISEHFGLKNRQDSNNFFREFVHSGSDFLDYLVRKSRLTEAFPLIENEILKYPLKSIKKHYKDFTTKYPEYKMSEQTFKKYVSQIDSLKLKTRIEALISKKEISINKDAFLKEILYETDNNRNSRKQIVDTFPELEQTDNELSKEKDFIKNSNKFGKQLLVMLLIGSGLNYKILSILLGVSKSTIHNLFYYLSFIKFFILRTIKWWSGRISTDEKWVKIKGKWRYVISIVDDVTGFPLYFQVVSDLRKDTWKLFFARFYKIYGIPRLIISDGSDAIAGAIKEIFPNTNHQLCKFHKLKNLMKKIYKCNCSTKKRRKMIKLAKGIFKNKSYFSRKRSAKRLMEIGTPEVAKYVKNSILGKWKQLTKGYTSNSAERWNRKIEKSIQGRYGLKSERFVTQLITSIWLKEILTEKRHFEKSVFEGIDFKKISQENIKMSHFIKYFSSNLLKYGG